MLIRAILTMVVALSASPSSAQFITFQDGRAATDYGSDDLGRAMKICASKEIPSHQSYVVGCFNTTCNTTVPGTYPEAWNACYRVRDHWNQSEAARNERERLEAIERDRQLVERVAGEGAP